MERVPPCLFRRDIRAFGRWGEGERRVQPTPCFPCFTGWRTRRGGTGPGGGGGGRTRSRDQLLRLSPARAGTPGPPGPSAFPLWRRPAGGALPAPTCPAWFCRSGADRGPGATGPGRASLLRSPRPPPAVPLLSARRWAVGGSDPGSRCPPRGGRGAQLLERPRRERNGRDPRPGGAGVRSAPCGCAGPPTPGPPRSSGRGALESRRRNGRQDAAAAAYGFPRQPARPKKRAAPGTVFVPHTGPRPALFSRHHADP